MYASFIRNMLLLVLSLVLVSPPAWAKEPVHYDRISLSAEAVSDVKYDVILANLSARRQGPNPGKLADEVNHIVSIALEKCHKLSAIEVQTQGYETSPVYEKGHQTGWRVSQSLQLKSRDPVVLGKLLGELQQDLLVTGMGYAVSPEMRNKTENKLIGKAIVEFRKRARIITRQLGQANYRIVSMRIDTAGNASVPLPVRHFQALSAERASPARIEAGKRKLTVTASGVIELK